MSCLKFVGPPSYPALPLPQHPNEKRYQFATPSTLKPTQIRCSEGSINQIPAWAEIKGDIRLTPFYNIHDCMKKFEGYVQELNDGESYDESCGESCDESCGESCDLLSL